MEMKIHGVDGYNKSCKNCREYFWAKRNNAKYCSNKCRQQHYRKKAKRKAFLQGLLSKYGLGSPKKDDSEESGSLNKIDYARLTFILSFIGFLGSIGFYLGVLRQVYSPASDKQKIEQLKEENKELQQTIMVIIEKEVKDNGAGE